MKTYRVEIADRDTGKRGYRLVTAQNPQHAQKLMADAGFIAGPAVESSADVPDDPDSEVRRLREELERVRTEDAKAHRARIAATSEGIQRGLAGCLIKIILFVVLTPVAIFVAFIIAQAILNRTYP